MYKTIQEQIDFIIKQSADIIIDVAGKDSYAALAKYLGENNSNAIIRIIPVVVKVPSEYGSHETLQSSFEKFKKEISNTYFVSFSETIFIEEPILWHYLNGRFIAEYIKKYDFYSPCCGCHIYLHSIRAYIANKLNIKTIISGERLSHGNKIKLNQLNSSIQYHSKILKEFGINHIQPILNISDNLDIDKIVNKFISNDDLYHYKCLFSSNYRLTNNDVNIPVKLQSFYELLIKITIKYLSILELPINLIEKEMTLFIANCLSNESN